MMLNRSKLLQMLAYLGMAVVLLFVLLMPLDYFVFLPGKALELREMVSVPDQDENDTGSFMMTVVLSQQANIPLYIRGMLDPNIDLYPAEQVRPSHISNEEYQQQMLDMMNESQLGAAAVALRESGYEVVQTGEGVLIITVSEESYAQGVLEPGDVLTALNGEPIHIREELTEAMIEMKPGDVVDLLVEREGEPFACSIELTPKTDDPLMGGIGIGCNTYRWSVQLPVEVNVHSQDIGGSSAGLMMSLEIMNQLDPEDITGGYRIAGTGTINFEGQVGPIGGVRQKVMGAIESEADFFFAPKENAEAARQQAGHKLTVVEVESIKDALAFLRSLNEQ